VVGQDLLSEFVDQLTQAIAPQLIHQCGEDAEYQPVFVIALVQAEGRGEGMADKCEGDAQPAFSFVDSEILLQNAPGKLG
jgi:hypothetical protein